MNEMIAAHDALPEGVYLVAVHDKEVFVQHAIFTDFPKAKAWMDSLPTKLTCMCAPFILNQPDAGKESVQ